MRISALSALVTGVLVASGLPAHASGCGIWGEVGVCPQAWYTPPTFLPDVFGDVYAWMCGGVFYYTGPEGNQDYYSGRITSGAALNTDTSTRRIQVTCSVSDSSTYGQGTERGSETASSSAPTNFVVSAVGDILTFWYYTDVNERLFLCTSVSWTDRVGVGHTWHVDWNKDAPGTQCPPLSSPTDNIGA